MSATVGDNGVAVLQFFPGLGYSPASGGPVGGLGVSATPLEFSTTFFGSDVKSLLPPNMTYGKRKSKRKSKNNKRSKRKSKRKIEEKVKSKRN